MVTAANAGNYILLSWVMDTGSDDMTSKISWIAKLSPSHHDIAPPAI
jgi:hypothetical protein